MKKDIIWYGIVAGFIFLDQLVKSFLFADDRGSRIIINSGGILGIGEAHSKFILFLSFLALLGIVILYRKTRHKLQRQALLLFITGLAMQTSDRLFRGGSLDYIYLQPFPVFNIADFLMLVGVLWYIVMIIIYVQRTKPY